MAAGCFNCRIFLDVIDAHSSTTERLLRGEKPISVAHAVVHFPWPYEARKNLRNARNPRRLTTFKRRLQRVCETAAAEKSSDGDDVGAMFF
jgi:hypothetical protein